MNAEHVTDSSFHSTRSFGLKSVKRMYDEDNHFLTMARGRESWIGYSWLI